MAPTRPTIISRSVIAALALLVKGDSFDSAEIMMIVIVALLSGGIALGAWWGRKLYVAKKSKAAPGL